MEHRGGLCSISSGKPFAGTASLAQDNARLRVFMSVRISTPSHQVTISTVTFSLQGLVILNLKTVCEMHGSACVRAVSQQELRIASTSRISKRHTSLYALTIQGLSAWLLQDNLEQ